MEVLDRPEPLIAPTPASGLEVAVDEAGARRSLRRQIARLERELGEATACAFPQAPPEVPIRPGAGPGLLTIGELEEARDDLAVRLAAARGTAAGDAARHERNRRRVERMMLEPSRYRYARVTREDVGESGCGGWEVRPRLGLLGMLAGWWRVKVSSGCPLATRQPDGRARWRGCRRRGSRRAWRARTRAVPGRAPGPSAPGRGRRVDHRRLGLR